MSPTSVVGFDNLPICRYTFLPLSSVIAPKESLRQLLAQLLIDAIEHGTHAQSDVLLAPGFAERDSTGPARTWQGGQASGHVPVDVETGVSERG